MQDCLNYWKSSDDARYIYVDNDKLVEVEAIETFRLLVRTGFYLDLNETFVVPSFKWNLIYVFNLDKFGYYCSFKNWTCNLFHDLKLVGTGSLSGYDNIYWLDIVLF